MGDAAHHPKKPLEPGDILARLQEAHALLDSVCNDYLVKSGGTPSDLYMALCYMRAALINHGDRFPRIH
jgi:hypothetical protein